MPGPFPHVAADHSQQRLGDERPHRLVIAGVPQQVAVARAFVCEVLGSGHPGIERVALLTSELVTNSITHSNSRRNGGTITVTVRATAEYVRVDVADDGGDTVPTLRCGDDLTEGGRGLWLVDAYSLTWDHQRSATRAVTWFECLPEPLP